MTKTVRVGVVGAGHFGRYHAGHYARNPRARLVGVCDINQATASKLATDVGCEALGDHRTLIGRVDAASVAVTTPGHFAVARDLMEAGIDVLVEKPMTHDLESARALTEIAERNKRILQVGHIERHSGSFRALSTLVGEPRYIESNRIAPWRARGTDTDVIHDLMIHDIDIILGLVRSPVTSVHAVGTPVFGDKIDIANARLEFASGCVATVTASRVSHKTHRSIRLFQASSYLVCDFADSRIYAYRLKGDPAVHGVGAVADDHVEVPREDSLANEIDAFLTCVIEHKKPLVDAHAGLAAMEVAHEIQRCIGQYRHRN